jgi:hypothetical protein
MKQFILDHNPKFGGAKVTLDNFTYELKRIKDNGCYLSVTNHDGIERDQLTLTTTDMRALFCLLTVNDCK